MVSKENVEEVSKHTNAKNLVDPVVNVKLKLAIFWIVLMWFYAYNDLMSFFRQDIVEGVLAGNIEGIVFTQPFLFAMALLMSFPIFMILLSVVLPARINRPVNVFAGIFHLMLLGITATVGDEAPWAYYALYMAFEGVIIALITWTAWKWPTSDGAPHGAPLAAGVELGI